MLAELAPMSKPLRYLPPGSAMELYDNYKFTCMEAVSYSTFRRTLKRWSKCLKFRAPSQHAKCSECTKLKQLRAETLSETERKDINTVLQGPCARMCSLCATSDSALADSARTPMTRALP